MSGMQVRSSVLVARTLIDEYATAQKRFVAAWRAQDDTEQGLIRAELERVYGAIWEQLDAAAKKTEAAGRSIAEYIEVRNDPTLDTAVAVKDVRETARVAGTEYRGGQSWTTVRRRLHMHDNESGLDSARRATKALEGAWPELDWRDTSADEPVPDLTTGGGKIAKWLGKLFARS